MMYDLLLSLLKKHETPAVTDSRNQLKDSGVLTSKRFLVVIGFGVGLYFLGALMSGDLVKWAAIVASVYIAGESFSKAVLAYANAIVKKAEIEADVHYEKMRDPTTGRLPWETPKSP